MEKALLMIYAISCNGGFIQWKQLETNINGGFCRRVAPGVLFCRRSADNMKSAYKTLLKGSQARTSQQRERDLALPQQIEELINNPPEMTTLKIAFTMYGIPYSMSENGQLHPKIRETIEPHVNAILRNQRNRQRNEVDQNLLMLDASYEEMLFRSICMHAATPQMRRLQDRPLTKNRAGELTVMPEFVIDTRISQMMIDTRIPQLATDTRMSQMMIGTKMSQSGIDVELPQLEMDMRLPQLVMNTEMPQLMIDTEIRGGGEEWSFWK